MRCPSHHPRFARRAAALLAGAVAPATIATANFTFTSFAPGQPGNASGIDGITLLPVAEHSSPTMSITPPVRAAAGAAWYTAARQPVGISFETTFEYEITDISNVGADGFAFVIQNSSPAALGGTGGALGYADNIAFPGPGQSGIANSIAVEFDMWDNDIHWNDFDSANHISVHTRGVNPNGPGAAASRGHVALDPGAVDLSSGVHSVSILYSLNVLEVFLDGDPTPVLSVPIDIDSTLSLESGLNAWVGFTSATGAIQNVQRHQIRSWSFTGQVPAPGAGLALATGALAAISRKSRARPTA